MADSYVKVEQQGWFQRLGGSIKGVLVGLVMVVVGLGLLFWGEGRAVKRAKALEEGATTVISVDASGPQTAQEGKLVHFSGETDTFDPVTDPVFGVRASAVRLTRRVEMYQWQEESRTEEKKKLGGGTERVTTYTYEQGWSDRAIDSSRFEKPEGHGNPPFPFESDAFTADPVVVGDWILGPVFVGKLTRDEPLRVSDADLAKVEDQVRSGLRVEDGGFYRGSSGSSPQLGDVRVRFTQVPRSTISVIGRQEGQQLVAYRAKVGGDIALLMPGMVAADAMFEAAKASNKSLTWILRLVGFMIVFIGFVAIFKPLSVLADVVPFIGNMVGAGTGFIAFLLAAALSLLTIAIGWLVYRPLLGILLLAAAGGFAYWMVKKLTTNKPDNFTGRPDSPAPPLQPPQQPPHQSPAPPQQPPPPPPGR